MLGVLSVRERAHSGITNLNREYLKWERTQVLDPQHRSPVLQCRILPPASRPTPYQFLGPLPRLTWRFQAFFGPWAPRSVVAHQERPNWIQRVAYRCPTCFHGLYICQDSYPQLDDPRRPSSTIHPVQRRSSTCSGGVPQSS